MPNLLQYAGQAAIYGAAALLVGYFATEPPYQQFPQGEAQVKLSFAHGAARKEACRRLTAKELARESSSMARPNTCARERVNVHVQLQIDDRIIYDAHLEPAGLAGDGPARTYRKFTVAPGKHTIVARMRDSRGEGPFDYVTTRETRLEPGQNLAIDFKADTGGFVFR
jgi:hypothetical protein